MEVIINKKNDIAIKIKEIKIFNWELLVFTDTDGPLAAFLVDEGGGFRMIEAQPPAYSFGFGLYPHKNHLGLGFCCCFAD